MSGRWLSALLVLGLGVLWVPEPAWACSVCGFGREENRMAFLLTTLILSVLPLAAIGGVVFWLVRQARARAGDLAAARAEQESTRA